MGFRKGERIGQGFGKGGLRDGDECQRGLGKGGRVKNKARIRKGKLITVGVKNRGETEAGTGRQGTAGNGGG